MKNNIHSMILAMAACISGQCLALTPITEEFESAKIDPVNWFYYHDTKSKLVQTNGVLNFRVLSKPLAGNYSSIELLTSQPSFNENWEMTLDITNMSSYVRTVGGGITIFNSVDRNDRLYISYYGKAGIGVGADTNKVNAHFSKLSPGVATATGGVRVSFSRKTKLLTIFLSDNMSGEGYQWRKIGSFSPNGVGGDARANWKLDPVSGGFGIQLFGNAVTRAISSGKITFDNFVLAGRP